MAKKLDGYYTFHDPDEGESKTFGPGDELPDWAVKQATEAKHINFEGDSDATDDAQALPTAGPGQVAGEGMSDDEKAEARKKYDRERKAAQRAEAKSKAEADAAAVKAAEAAEAQRKAEADAAAKQGGGS